MSVLGLQPAEAESQAHVLTYVAALKGVTGFPVGLAVGYQKT